MSWQTIGAMSVLTSMAFLGCGDSLAEAGQELVGSWNWVESSGGIAGITMTPESTGGTMMLRFHPEGMVELVQNDAVERSVAFTTTATKEASTWEILYEAPLFGGFESQTAALTGDTLILADGCCDGFVYRFERVR